MCLCFTLSYCSSFLFFFNDSAPPEIYTLSLHDALPISWTFHRFGNQRLDQQPDHARIAARKHLDPRRDRKSTRLNSSHSQISYAVFCLKKKKTTENLCRRRHPARPTHIVYRPSVHASSP